MWRRKKNKINSENQFIYLKNDEPDFSNTEADNKELVDSEVVEITILTKDYLGKQSKTVIPRAYNLRVEKTSDQIEEFNFDRGRLLSFAPRITTMAFKFDPQPDENGHYLTEYSDEENWEYGCFFPGAQECLKMPSSHIAQRLVSAYNAQGSLAGERPQAEVVRRRKEPTYKLGNWENMP